MNTLSRKFVLLAAGVTLLSTGLYAKDEKKEEAVKPSIKEMTSEKTSEQVSSQIPDSGSLDDINIHSVGFGLGQTTLGGNFSKNGKDKITPSFFYNYSASHTFDLLVEFHTSKHKFQNKSVRITSLPIGVKAKLWHYDAFTPFALGGLGFYMPKLRRDENGSLVDTDSKVTLGFHLGGGLDLRLNRHFSVGILGAYYDPFNVQQDHGGDVTGRYYQLLMTGFYYF